jgi:ABC-type transport system involved in multi-copper enzyme maturation permease subunit
MATTTAPAPQARLATLPPAKGKAGLGGALASEWTKIRTVRSTYWTLFALLVISIGFTALACYATAHRGTHLGHGAQLGFDPTTRSLDAVIFFAPLVMMVLGALVMTAEYSTGMIRPSLTAQPRRGTVFIAKGIIFAVVALVVSFITAFAAFFIGQQLLKSTGHYATISDPNVLRAIVGTALYVSVIGLMSYAFGAIIRHTAGTIATMAGVVFVLRLVVEILPTSWTTDVTRWLPTTAGDALSSTAAPDPTLYAPWTEFGITVGYTVILLIIGAILLKKRDA